MLFMWSVNDLRFIFNFCTRKSYQMIPAHNQLFQLINSNTLESRQEQVILSFRRNVQIGSEGGPAYYGMGIRGPLFKNEESGA